MSKLFGENLKKVRQARGLTMTECANLLRISQPAWNFWELGQREPKLDVLIMICDILDTTPNILLGANFDIEEPYVRPSLQEECNDKQQSCGEYYRPLSLVSRDLENLKNQMQVSLEKIKVLADEVAHVEDKMWQRQKRGGASSCGERAASCARDVRENG